MFLLNIFNHFVINCFAIKGLSLLKTKYSKKYNVLGVIEMRDQILTTSYWLHVELGK
jgi:hypothetical protein